MAALRFAMVPVAILAVLTPPPWSSEGGVEWAVESMGLLLLIVGVAIRLWASVHISGRKNLVITTEGPYSLCRHPLYVGTTIACVGGALSLESLPLAAIVLLIVAPIHALAATSEEARLEHEFGPSYREYRERVPAFLPSFRNYRCPERIEVDVRRLLRAARETLPFLAVPALHEVHELAIKAGWIGHLW